MKSKPMAQGSCFVAAFSLFCAFQAKAYSRCAHHLKTIDVLEHTNKTIAKQNLSSSYVAGPSNWQECFQAAVSASEANGKRFPSSRRLNNSPLDEGIFQYFRGGGFFMHARYDYINWVYDDSEVPFGDSAGFVNAFTSNFSGGPAKGDQVFNPWGQNFLAIPANRVVPANERGPAGLGRLYP